MADGSARRVGCKKSLAILFSWFIRPSFPLFSTLTKNRRTMNTQDASTIKMPIIDSVENYGQKIYVRISGQWEKNILSQFVNAEIRPCVNKTYENIRGNFISLGAHQPEYMPDIPMIEICSNGVMIDTGFANQPYIDALSTKIRKENIAMRSA